MFSVIIPTAQKNLSIFNRLLKEIENSDLVNEIIIINNHAKKLTDLNFSKTRILEQGKNIYVNPAWNLGVEEAKNEYIAILNDDIYIPKELFKKIYEFIFKNKNCGLIGLDSLKISQTNDVSNTEEEFIANIYPTDVRNFCWGSGIFGKKDNFYKIPNDLKIWYGDDYLFEQNIKFNKKNYKLSSPNIKHYHSLTSNNPCFDEIKKQDELNYKKYEKSKIKIKKHKVFKIFGFRNEKFDLFISLGSACASALILKKCKLRLFSSPFDWLYGSNIVDRAKILANDFEDFINKEDLIYLDTREHPEPRKIYKNTKNGLVFNHDFSYTNSLNEDYPKVFEKYTRRANRLLTAIEKSNSACFVYIQNPNEREEILNKELIEAQQTLAKRFPNTRIYLLHLFCERGLELKNAGKNFVSDDILQFRFDYDAYNEEFPYTTNNKKLRKLFRKYKLTWKSLLGL